MSIMLARTSCSFCKSNFSRPSLLLRARSSFIWTGSFKNWLRPHEPHAIRRRKGAAWSAKFGLRGAIRARTVCRRSPVAESRDLSSTAGEAAEGRYSKQGQTDDPRLQIDTDQSIPGRM